MKIKNIFFLSMISVAVIALSIGFYSKNNQVKYLQPDYAVYDNESDFVKEASDIIVGEIIDNKVEKIKIAFTEGKKYENDEDKMTYTISNVKVLTGIKGDLKNGDIIRIKQLGDGQRIIDKTVIDNGGYYKKGNKKVFFLKSFKQYDVPYSVINPIQGQIDTENGKTIKNKNNSLFSDKENENELIAKIKSLMK